MAEVVHYEVIEIPEIYIIGSLIRTSMEEIISANPVTAFWDECFRKEIFKQLNLLHIYSEDYFGFECDFDMETGAFSYIVGMLIYPDNWDLPNDFTIKKIEATKAAFTWISGDTLGDVAGNAFTLSEAAIKEHNDSYHIQWTMEGYNVLRYNPTAEKVVMDYYIPLD
jgi:predicted transcriptional regulator YdeE